MKVQYPFGAPNVHPLAGGPDLLGEPSKDPPKKPKKRRVKFAGPAVVGKTVS